MTELTPRQRAAIRKRENTSKALLDAADGVFTDSDYSGITVQHIINNAGVSMTSFYNVFSSKGKSAWGAAVLDRRLNRALTERAVPQSPRAQLVGYLSLLDKVSAPLHGITQALVDERTDGRMEYDGLLPEYYYQVVDAITEVKDQQGERDLCADISPSATADFVLDSIALAYAVHMDDPAARARSLSLALSSTLATD